MESKSTSCIVTSLVVAFVVMLVLSTGVHAAMHKMTPDPEDVKSLSVVVPGVEAAFNYANVAVWGLVAAAGAGVKSVASYLLTHHR